MARGGTGKKRKKEEKVPAAKKGTSKYNAPAKMSTKKPKRY